MTERHEEENRDENSFRIENDIGICTCVYYCTIVK